MSSGERSRPPCRTHVFRTRWEPSAERPRGRRPCQAGPRHGSGGGRNADTVRADTVHEGPAVRTVEPVLCPAGACRLCGRAPAACAAPETCRPLPHPRRTCADAPGRRADGPARSRWCGWCRLAAPVGAVRRAGAARRVGVTRWWPPVPSGRHPPGAGPLPRRTRPRAGTVATAVRARRARHARRSGPCREGGGPRQAGPVASSQRISPSWTCAVGDRPAAVATAADA